MATASRLGVFLLVRIPKDNAALTTSRLPNAEVLNLVANTLQKLVAVKADHCFIAGTNF